jgi:MoCo/4Fe-4S cofactor protein with predicted Tat translocation signal
MSKRKWIHPEAGSDNKTLAWRSPGHLKDTPEFREWLEREFPRGAAEMSDGDDQDLTRRSFMKLMGASTALAGFGMAACQRPEAYILPYSQAPEWVVPGKALYYASAMPRATGAVPLVVTTYQGRPTKLEPNTLHPDSAGADLFAQASVLELYSPDRSKEFLKKGKSASRADFEAAMPGILSAASAGPVGIVFGEDDSPTRSRLAAEIAAKFPGARLYSYEALAGDGRKAAMRAAFGDGSAAVVNFAKADKILSLDSDFVLLDDCGPVTPFFDRRKPEGGDYAKAADKNSLNRLYVAEGRFTLTGGMADHRLRVAPSQVIGIAAAVARELGLSELVASIPALDNAAAAKWAKECALDLKASGGNSVVLAGARQSEGLHQIVIAINQKLGSYGKAISVVQTGRAGLLGLADLHKALAAKELQTLILLTPGNPVFDAPVDYDFAKLLKQVPLSIHLGLRADATARACTWHIPAAHYLESWSDARSATGVYTLIQPMILPLFGGVAEIDLLLALLGTEGALKPSAADTAMPAMTAVRATFSELTKGSDAAWAKALRDGFVGATAYAAVTKAPAAGKAAALGAAVVAAPKVGSYEVVFATDYSVLDGRYIDNGWLQEAPDPVSKISWDNAALISPQTAKDMGVYDAIVELEPEAMTPFGKRRNAQRAPGKDDEGQGRTAPMIKVKVNGKEQEIAVIIAFGQADNIIVLPLGYGQGFDEHDELGRATDGQHDVGQVGRNRGFNVYPLRTAASAYTAAGATITNTEDRYSIAMVQEHHAMYGRALAREVSTMTGEEKHDDFAKQIAGVQKQGNDAHAPKNISLYQQKGSEVWHPNEKGEAPSLLPDEKHQWAMTIDLSSCMGCNSCLVACQAENNIPIVGKRQVAMGREMHWIRMDRYFAVQENADHDNPAMIPQPVACMQCESAPCETVCPVNATVHTEDGLNAMAYNRCIGTRYCANNCPYKVRRFNFFDYNKRNPLIEGNLYKGPLGETQVGDGKHLQRNPNVTVRMRGVMEKCTYCVQRLKGAVIRQKTALKKDVLLSGKPSEALVLPESRLRIPVDSVKTACQDACPANAISFGNQRDGDASKMMRAQSLERSYDLLAYIGTRPRTKYMARVKNPNPKMADAAIIGRNTIDMV